MALFCSTSDGTSPLSKVHVIRSTNRHTGGMGSETRRPGGLPKSLSNSMPDAHRNVVAASERKGGQRRMTVKEAAERKMRAMEAKRRMSAEHHKRNEEQQHKQMLELNRVRRERKGGEEHKRSETCLSDKRPNNSRASNERGTRNRAQAETPDTYVSFSNKKKNHTSSVRSDDSSNVVTPQDQPNRQSSSRSRKDEVWKLLSSPDPKAAASATAALRSNKSSTGRRGTSSEQKSDGGRIIERARRAMSSIESKLEDAKPCKSRSSSEEHANHVSDSVWKDAREPPAVVAPASSTRNFRGSAQAGSKPFSESKTQALDEGKQEEGKTSETSEPQNIVQGPRERIKARRQRRGSTSSAAGPPAGMKSDDGVDPRPPAGPPPRSGRWKAVPSRFRMPEKELVSSPSDLPRRPSLSRRRSPLAMQNIDKDSGSRKDAINISEEKVVHEEEAVAGEPESTLARFGRRSIAAEAKKKLREVDKLSQAAKSKRNPKEILAEELARKKEMKRRARTQMFERSPLTPIQNTLAATGSAEDMVSSPSVAGNTNIASIRRPLLTSSSPSSTPDGRKERRSKKTRKSKKMMETFPPQNSDCVIDESAFPISIDNEDSENNENSFFNANNHQTNNAARTRISCSAPTRERKRMVSNRSTSRHNRELSKSTEDETSPGGKLVASSPATPITPSSSSSLHNHNSNKANTPQLPVNSPFYSHLRCCQGLSELKSRVSTILTGQKGQGDGKKNEVFVASPSSASPFCHAEDPDGVSQKQGDPINQGYTCEVILVAGKVKPVPTIAVQFRDSRLPAGMLRLVEVELPLVEKPATLSIKRFVQERTEELVARLRSDAPGFSSAPAHKLRKVLGSLLVATVREEGSDRNLQGKV